jgi:hypothetical protein
MILGPPEAPIMRIKSPTVFEELSLSVVRKTIVGLMDDKGFLKGFM